MWLALSWQRVGRYSKCWLWCCSKQTWISPYWYVFLLAVTTFTTSVNPSIHPSIITLHNLIFPTQMWVWFCAMKCVLHKWIHCQDHNGCQCSYENCWHQFSCIEIVVFCFFCPNAQQVSMGSDNGLVLQRGQATTWDHADPVQWRMILCWKICYSCLCNFSGVMCCKNLVCLSEQALSTERDNPPQGVRPAGHQPGTGMGCHAVAFLA